mmetsp:Transcript_19170/g.32398  ORF Transcript_19170/g.32398 Transcript_19170/m.32398 type:complete len:234 (+) Transcript_19170:118-819(+)
MMLLISDYGLLLFHFTCRCHSEIALRARHIPLVAQPRLGCSIRHRMEHHTEGNVSLKRSDTTLIQLLHYHLPINNGFRLVIELLSECQNHRWVRAARCSSSDCTSRFTGAAICLTGCQGHFLLPHLSQNLEIIAHEIGESRVFDVRGIFEHGRVDMVHTVGQEVLPFVIDILLSGGPPTGVGRAAEIGRTLLLEVHVNQIATALFQSSRCFQCVSPSSNCCCVVSEGGLLRRI